MESLLAVLKGTRICWLLVSELMAPMSHCHYVVPRVDLGIRCLPEVFRPGEDLISD